MAILTYSTELKIASGWDNTAGYDLITDLTDGDSIPYILPVPFMLNMGTTKARLSRRAYHVDSLYASWTFKAITVKQLNKLDSDYQQTGDAKVTVRSIEFDGTYEDWNAYIVVPRRWDTMLESPTGAGVMTPGNYKANWLADVIIGFNIIDEAS